MKFQRLKYRRRDVSSHRYFHQMCGTRQDSVSRVVPIAAPQNVKKLRGSAQVALPSSEMRNVIRMEGDSIAYFWALETESAIAYETLVLHWREFARALVHEPTATRSLLCTYVDQ